MNSKMLNLSAALLTLCFLLPSPAFAGKKDAGKKELQDLHSQLKNAGEKGDLQTAISTAESSYETAIDTYGQKSLEAANELTNVANLYMYAEHPAEAENMYKTVIAIQSEKLKGKKDQALSDSLFNLAMAYAMQKKYDDARAMLSKAYKLRVERSGEDSPEAKKIREMQEEVYKDSAAS